MDTSHLDILSRKDRIDYIINAATQLHTSVTLPDHRRPARGGAWRRKCATTSKTLKIDPECGFE